MVRRIFLSDLPPTHPAFDFVPVFQTIVVLLVVVTVLLIVNLCLKEYNFFWVRRRLIESAQNDQHARQTLGIIKEMVDIAREHRVKTAGLLDKVDQKVDEIKTTTADSFASSSGTIPTVQLPKQ